ncbi:MAG: formate dehydrogenase accessory sulfurtransferase FdhD [Xanthomonadales bacterium]|uniref:formate dehydrogenase accessory sulfurtransferase FdhD n=4 Tax=Dokdonella sp. TaxID=2291710 RepID=UPI002C463CD2|nr:formate dehydrogenase accessory sulfurtransferase FdhD [Xanthomonadales bacterium]HQW77583.1 formate dehydrogenase accessory sulfurtransferase FdhD [Dokdonella sp.]MBK7012811.1 formate dehydrogenase accessory sulfurtransferase FdhD [Xanthomonadales bacterium]MBK7210333.1 formate dehydrogenase accessory sulfurtransferase FdhD [Xanthomonadales bacterium]MBL0223786.1 formate dehydrogenase accessory sulfurtransferase FdhD [Xanthomonadales bacterium]
MSDAESARSSGHVRRRIMRWRSGGFAEGEDEIAEEQPVELRYNEQPFAVMMATPADLEDFALGFSMSEGLIATPAQLLEVDAQTLLEGVQLNIRVDADAPAAQLGQTDRRLLPGRSGCGICGTRQLENALRAPGRVHARLHLRVAELERALEDLQQRQPANAATGAMHAAAWLRPGDPDMLVREDVGRHNALDKLIGALCRAGLDPASGFVLITSRASYEMVTKAASVGISALAAISAPTALAIELARSAGMTLIGFARPGSCNVYCGGERLQG